MALDNLSSGNFIYVNDVSAILQSNSNYDFVITGLTTTEKGGGADMSVDVAAGGAMANDTFVNATSTTNVGIDASDVSDDRIDLVTIDSSGTIAITKGTNYDPATEAVVPPALPANKTLLSYVSVEHGATTITNNEITDARVFNKNWRLVHSETHAPSTTPTEIAVSYEAYSASSEIMIIASGYSYIKGWHTTSGDLKGYLHTFTINVNGGAAVVTRYASRGDYHSQTDGYFGGQSSLHIPINAVLDSGDITFSTDNTINITSATASLADGGYTLGQVTTRCITDVMVFAR